MGLKNGRGIDCYFWVKRRKEPRPAGNASKKKGGGVCMGHKLTTRQLKEGDLRSVGGVDSRSGEERGQASKNRLERKRIPSTIKEEEKSDIRLFNKSLMERCVASKKNSKQSENLLKNRAG